MTETDDVWGRAVEAGAAAIFDEEGPESIDDDGAEALAEVALRAALPVLLADLADREEAALSKDADVSVWGFVGEAINRLRKVHAEFASEVSR